MQRHKDNGHIASKLTKAHEAGEVAQADNLLKEVRGLRSKAVSLLLQAEAAGDLRTAFAGIREARGCLELLARLTHELDERPQVNILLAPEWAMVRQALMDALTALPHSACLGCKGSRAR